MLIALLASKVRTFSTFLQNFQLGGPGAVWPVHERPEHVRQQSRHGPCRVPARLQTGIPRRTGNHDNGRNSTHRFTASCYFYVLQMERERNVLINDTLNTFYLRLYGRER